MFRHCGMTIVELAIMLLSCLVGSNAWGTVQYSVVNLGGGTAYGINDGSQVVGRAGIGSQQEDLVYGNGTTTCSAHSAARASVAFGVNNVGQVVGESDTTSGYSHAFLYGEGTMTDLGTLGFNGGAGSGINDAGEVVGDVFEKDGSTGTL